MKMETILRKFSFIFFLFKPLWFNRQVPNLIFGLNLLNNRNELGSKCKYENKYSPSNYKSTAP